ncbi:hypothetical protein EMCG_04429 [[Emmonsia] crescens]|uniref:Uncharacterized protein n=1 Tax=[Emmonsia] crescens TaxID=73230 RepID=A0A0G2HTA2_9EURO|nr:hypothetical protein EMCG_04429 [Emmonsia crescens UAMH 3008]
MPIKVDQYHILRAIWYRPHRRSPAHHISSSTSVWLSNPSHSPFTARRSSQAWPKVPR